MEKTIELERKQVTYTLRASRRAKSIRLTVACGGALTVSAPPWVGESRIEKFILEKSAWVLDRIRYFNHFPKAVPVRRVNRWKHFAEHKEKARAFVLERLAHFNAFYGFKWNRVAIRNQRSRWGSCSRGRNLNFNYRLALLPPRLADYIIVHELCHLVELNHSAEFWSLVARALPNHRALRSELRKVGMNFL
jgi:predicted metal-dependent hydrolase